VVIQGTNHGATTDVDGRFTVRRAPAGDHILEIRYLGYVTQEVPISVSADERTEQNIELAGDVIVGDEGFVVGYQRGQARALTRQRESPNIRSVISSEQMDRFADVTVEGALAGLA
jgi:hypothetical protein